MSTVKKSFIINENFLNISKSHIVDLFKPKYNPFTDSAANASAAGVPVTKHFPLQYYPFIEPGQPSSNFSPVRTAYNTPNIISGMFLVTENFINFMTKVNNLLLTGSLPTVFTPVSYTQNTGTDSATKPWLVTADSTYTQDLLDIFAGPAGNVNASSGLKYIENTLAVRGIEGITAGVASEAVVSTSVTEMFLRHLYSLDPLKRQIAFDCAKNYYGISAAEVNTATLEMIPIENFNPDLFEINITKDTIKFDYNQPLKLQTKFLETTHNVANKKLYLYFPFITSNAFRSKANYDYRNLITCYTGMPSVNNVPARDLTSINKDGYVYNQSGTKKLAPAENMPTLTNSLFSVAKNKIVDQCGFTSVQISEVGGGGDIQFDHTDKIDYIDSLTLEVKAPIKFS